MNLPFYSWLLSGECEKLRHFPDESKVKVITNETKIQLKFNKHVILQRDRN